MRNEIDRALAGHPSEEWTAQDQYEKDLKEFEARMEEEKPRAQDYDNPEEFKKDMAAWEMALSCDRPNRPGYYRANND